MGKHNQCASSLVRSTSAPIKRPPLLTSALPLSALREHASCSHTWSSQHNELLTHATYVTSTRGAASQVRISFFLHNHEQLCHRELNERWYSTAKHGFAVRRPKVLLRSCTAVYERVTPSLQPASLWWLALSESTSHRTRALSSSLAECLMISRATFFFDLQQRAAKMRGKPGSLPASRVGQLQGPHRRFRIEGQSRFHFGSGLDGRLDQQRRRYIRPKA